MNDRLRYLYDCYLNKTATISEQKEFAELLRESSSLEIVKEWIGNEMEKNEEENLITSEQAEEVFRQVMFSAQKKSQNVIKTNWIKYAAAIIILITAGVYLYKIKTPAKNLIATTVIPVKTQIIPGGNKALLTLADGTTILLDSAANGKLANQGNTQVVKLANGQIVYRVNGQNSKPAGFNTMSTPRGGQYQLKLPDGTMVWLNASSSITYPTVFSGTERRVEVTGELYFEVVKNPKMPFKVHMSNAAHEAADQDLEVLGTHFNVNSYSDEPASTITLLEGAVKINKSVLKPGEAYTEGKISNVNTEEAIAWKNGYFLFNEADIKTVMRQISRWYDVKISYEGNIPDRRFGGEILRESELSDVLRALEINQVHFRLSGRNLVITP